MTTPPDPPPLPEPPELPELVVPVPPEAVEQTERSLYVVSWAEPGMDDPTGVVISRPKVQEIGSLTHVNDDHGLAVVVRTDRLVSIVRADLVDDEDDDDEGGGGGPDDGERATGEGLADVIHLDERERAA